MKTLARRFGLLLLMAAALSVAGHIYEHAFAAAANSFYDCPVCQSIMAASAHAAAPAGAELVFLRDAAISAAPDYCFSPAGTVRSRAPPSVLFS